MVKKAIEAETNKIEPRFAHGTVVSNRSLVVDANGKSWWVDPQKMMIQPAISRS